MVTDPFSLPILHGVSGSSAGVDEAVTAAREWVSESVPESWRAAGESGGPRAVRTVRTVEEYRQWYPTFGRSGLVASGWDLHHGGLGWRKPVVKAVEAVLAPYHLPRLNPLGLNLAAPALFAHGTEAQRRRFLPPIVRADEIWCQLFSEPGSGSDLASLSTKAVREGDEWVISGAKIWTTWADQADFGVLLARTDPDLPKHQGITYFLVDMRQDAIDTRPLLHMGGESEFFEVFIDGARVPDDQRIGEVGDGWRVAQSTLSGERQMVSGSGSGGVDRVGGVSAGRLIRQARSRDTDGLPGGWSERGVRDRLIKLWCEERVRSWTNQRVREQMSNKLAPGPESSIGKVHGSDLNQRIQAAAADLLGASGIAWAGDPAVPEDYAGTMPAEVKGMLRSRANTIEGGTTEVNKTVLAERVLGMPKDFDPWKGKPWRELPRG